jgi:DMSO/TMAO reductase YedYZ molybdopterin-dependent catalytic subunit
VLHVGDVPTFDPGTWGLLVEGEVEHPLRLAWRDLQNLPRVEVTCDMHGATGWTCRGLRWEGVPLAAISAACAPRATAQFLVARDGEGYSAGLPLQLLDERRVLLAVGLNGAPLEARRGGPLRLLVPERYGWKSVKWLRRLEFRAQDEAGYWELRGAHPLADPWLAQRSI